MSSPHANNLYNYFFWSFPVLSHRYRGWDEFLHHVTALKMEITPPQSLVKLPRSTRPNTAIQFAIVLSNRQGTRRRRKEICAAIDGDSLSIYEVILLIHIVLRLRVSDNFQSSITETFWPHILCLPPVPSPPHLSQSSTKPSSKFTATHTVPLSEMPSKSNPSKVATKIHKRRK